MEENVIAVFIPIVMTITIGLVMVTFFYLKSKERQLFIEKGLTAEEMKEFYNRKKDPFILLKIGVISLFFGVGLGLGIMMQENTGRDFWVPFLLFTFSGAGFIVSNILGRIMLKRESSSNGNS